MNLSMMPTYVGYFASEVKHGGPPMKWQHRWPAGCFRDRPALEEWRLYHRLHDRLPERTQPGQSTRRTEWLHAARRDCSRSSTSPQVERPRSPSLTAPKAQAPTQRSYCCEKARDGADVRRSRTPPGRRHAPSWEASFYENWFARTCIAMWWRAHRFQDGCGAQSVAST